MNKKTLLIAVIALVVGIAIGWSSNHVSISGLKSNAQRLPNAACREPLKLVEMGEFTGCYNPTTGEVTWNN